MKKSRWIVGLFAAICLSFCIPVCGAEPNYSDASLFAGYDEYIVFLKDDTSLMSDSSGSEEIDWTDFEVMSSEELEECVSDGSVLFYEPNYPVWLMDAGTGASVAESQWNLKNIKVGKAWENGFDGSGVKVGVIDSGVYPFADFGDRLLTGYNYVNSTSSTKDGFGHGTFVAGIIAASPVTQDTSGVAPGAKIVPLKCFSDKGVSSEVAVIAKAINDAVDTYGCQVLNMSLGMTANVMSKTLEEAIAHAVEEDCIVVASVGNYGSGTLYYPAACDDVIGVGAVTKQNVIWTSSQRNESVDVVAPGVDMESVRISGYKDRNGTSFSAPHVTALAAIAKQIDPEITADEFLDVLKSSSLDLGNEGRDNDYGYGLIDVEAAVKVLTEGLLLSDMKIGVIPNQMYTGSELTPALTIQNKEETTTLEEGVDYTLSYSNNKNSGTATVTITGISNYLGSVKRTFKIVPRNLNTVDIALSETETYTGTEIKPEPVVKYNTVTLEKGVDYTVAYENNTNAGTATVTITGIGNYTGSVEKEFTISQVDLEDVTITLSESEWYTGTEIKPEPVVKYNGVSLKAGTDYAVAYENNTNVGTATVTITGIGNYKGSVERSFTIYKLDLADVTITLSERELYTGTEIKPEPVVKYNSVSLKAGTDYAVAYENNTNVGTATVTMTGMGKCKGSVERTFTIAPRPLSTVTVHLTKQELITGAEIKPEPELKYQNTVLNKGTDYTVVYANNIELGFATVTITGVDNYTGSIQRYFEIVNHNWGEWAAVDNMTHSRSCCDDGCEEMETKPHSYKNGLCEFCGAEMITYSIGDGVLNVEFEDLEDGGHLYLAFYKQNIQIGFLSTLKSNTAERAAASFSIAKDAVFARVFFLNANFQPVRSELCIDLSDE